MADQTEENQRHAPGFNAAARVVHQVDPARLALGRWDAGQEQHLGEGDIYASYSADRIAMSGSVRRPFTFQGESWVCTGNLGGGSIEVSTAYRLVPLEHFEGAAVTYHEKTDDSAAARADPDGFYHGIVVQHRGQPHVLCGPPIDFTPGPTIQPGLFK